MRPCAPELVGARRHNEGYGWYEGRETKVGDTGPWGCPILNEDVTLEGGIVLAELILARANTAPDMDNLNSLLSNPRG